MEGGMTKRPDEIVAEKIVEKLQKNNLIPENRITEFTRKLSSGNLSIEDWKLLAELSIEEDKGGQNGQKD
jgi:hypothetical protein